MREVDGRHTYEDSRGPVVHSGDDPVFHINDASELEAALQQFLGDRTSSRSTGEPAASSTGESLWDGSPERTGARALSVASGLEMTYGMRSSMRASRQLN